MPERRPIILPPACNDGVVNAWAIPTAVARIRPLAMLPQRTLQADASRGSHEIECNFVTSAGYICYIESAPADQRTAAAAERIVTPPGTAANDSFVPRLTGCGTNPRPHSETACGLAPRLRVPA